MPHPPTHIPIPLPPGARGWVVVNEGSHPQCTQSEKGFILGCNVDIGKRTAFYRIQHRIWIFFLVMIFHPGNFLLGLLGWREKHRAVNPPSQSPIWEEKVKGMTGLSIKEGGKTDCVRDAKSWEH
jgi:hypothetical protein